MPKDKLFEIELEILSIRGPEEVDLESVTGKLILDDLQTLIRVSEPITFHFSHIDSGLVIQLSLIYLNNVLGNISFTVGELLQGSATGTSVQEFPFESGYIMVLRIISDERGDLNRLESVTPALECKCPYLHKLSEVHILEEEARIILDKVKNEIGQFIGDVDERARSPERSEQKRKADRSPSKSPTRSPYIRGGFKEEKAPTPQELPEIQIPSRHSMKMLNLDKDEVNIMRQVAMSMIQKLALFKIHSEEIDLIQKHMEGCDKAKHDLLEYMNETDDHVSKNINTMELFSSEYAEREEQANQEIETLMMKIEHVESEVRDAKKLEKELEEIGDKYKEEQGDGRELDCKLQELTSQYNSIEKRRTDIEDNFRNKMNEIIERKNEIEKERNNGFMEKQRVEIQLNSCISRKDRLTLENVQLNQELETNEGELAIKRVLTQQYVMQQALNEDEALAEKSLKSQVQDLQVEKESHQALFQQTSDSLEKDVSNVLVTSITLSSTIEDKETQISVLKDQLSEMNENLATLDQLMIMKENLDNTLTAVQKATDLTKFSKDKTLAELAWVSDYGFLQSKSLITENRLYNRVKKTWDEKVYEIQALLLSLAEEKAKNPVYFPLKDDPVDVALGEYINNRTEDISAPFIREAPGIYIFGTKRVWIKYEKSRLSVKIGGGFLPIKDFIDAYGDIEHAKFTAKNTPLSPQQKKVLGKFVGGLLRSSSPESPSRLKEKVLVAVNNKAHASAYAVMRPNSRSQSPSKMATPKKRLLSPVKRASLTKPSPNKAS
jgi:hypothetical protein